jgi:hypothetical protein
MMMFCEKHFVCRIQLEVFRIYNQRIENLFYHILASIFDIQGIDIAQLLAHSKQGEFTTEFKRSDLYLEKTIEPKVFMPFYTAPYTLPRKVEIER